MYAVADTHTHTRTHFSLVRIDGPALGYWNVPLHATACCRRLELREKLLVYENVLLLLSWVFVRVCVCVGAGSVHAELCFIIRQFIGILLASSFPCLQLTY